MADTYTQLHVHAVFATKYRDAVIHPSFEVELHKYITGGLQSYGHKMLQINGMPDHLHLLFGMRPTQAISDLMKTLKEESSRWINKNGLVRGRFRWQEGFGAFAVEKKNLPPVATYIELQKTHHKTLTFREEYLRILKRYEVEFKEEYIFQPLI